MTEHIRRPAEAPRRIGSTWVEVLGVAALAVAIVLLRALGTLPPDAASPVAPWFLDALRTATGAIGG